GVLIDNTVLSPQYRRLLGEFLPTELGGDPIAWTNANVGAASRAYARYQQAYLTAPTTSIRDWYAEDVRRWLYEMCDEVGRQRPHQCLEVRPRVLPRHPRRYGNRRSERGRRR